MSFLFHHWQLFIKDFPLILFQAGNLAQPFRFLCHNGEINTLSGNVNWMNARARISDSDFFSKEFKDINPLIFDGVSDSAAFDNALEYLIIGGYDIEEAMMLLNS